jgi:hypothetical protein
MFQSFADRQIPFQDRRMWRLLLARLHPDAGGDHEMFLFACDLKDRFDGERDSGAPDDNARQIHLSAWRSAMGSWASGNRDALSRPTMPRRSSGNR